METAMNYLPTCLPHLVTKALTVYEVAPSLMEAACTCVQIAGS